MIIPFETVTYLTDTTFSRGAQIPGGGSLWRQNFCPLTPVVGSRYGFALSHPYGARMLKLFLDIFKIPAPSPGIIIEELYKARKVYGPCDR
jgi:hypothetical protein